MTSHVGSQKESVQSARSRLMTLQDDLATLTNWLNYQRLIEISMGNYHCYALLYCLVHLVFLAIFATHSHSVQIRQWVFVYFDNFLLDKKYGKKILVAIRPKSHTRNHITYAKSYTKAVYNNVKLLLFLNCTKWINELKSNVSTYFFTWSYTYF